ncbi:MAG TPA: M12 family metallo-peptidase [Fimbriimonadaceae bacterium]|nr:M12 family metallo-peptidase [Fimbriimonadaceae bacterium]
MPTTMPWRSLAAVLFATTTATAALAQSTWQPITIKPPTTADAYPALPYLSGYAAFRLDKARLAATLASAPREGLPLTIPAILELPTPDGGTQRFEVVESPILSPELAARIPIRTYFVQGIDDPLATGRIDFGTYGFHGSVHSSSGDFIIDPVRRGDTTRYLAFYRRDNRSPRSDFFCATASQPMPTPGDGPGIQTTGPTLKTYRLALNTTLEYTGYFGGVTQAEAAATTSVNRVNGVYEKDVAVRMNITYLKCWPTGSADPFSNGNGGAMLSQNQSNLDSTVGNANYDIGHVFSTGGGGVAGLAVVGITGQKAYGVTGLPSPVGDPFDIDYVAHEMGHQYGGRHSFNGTTSACGGGNRDATSAYEPGSGSTIMGYAGICGAENLQNNSDAYFHTRSIDEIVNWRNNAASGGTSSNTGNGAPTVNAGADYTIPQSTPFRLRATASDPNGHPLTYCWEQFNLGTASPTTNNTTRPLFRSFTPVTSNQRIFPRLPDILSGAATPWEILPNVNRSMTFRCTVRDNRAGGGGVEQDSAVITVSGAAMVVTSPNTNVEWFANSTRTVTWTVGGGSVSPNVNILLSTNGGTSYGTDTATVLAANVPNDGSHDVVLPNIATTTARIFVESANGVFFDVSNVNFRITQATISGNVSLGDFTGNVTIRPVTFELRAVGSTTPIQTVTLNLASNGNYSFVAGIPSTGVYDLTAKGLNWLRKKRASVTITSSGATGQNFALINGDVNGDNSVDVGDFSVLSSAFGRSLGEGGFVLGADLDGDDTIDIGDYSILSSKFGLNGDD